jgi:hypothetical protein
MDSSSALEEEALAIVSIYGPSSFYALSGSSDTVTTAGQPQDTPVYTLKVSLEEPDFDFDPTSTDNNNNNNAFGGYSKNSDILNKVRKELEFRIYFPKGYPETNPSAPVHEIVSIYYGNLRLTDAILQEIDQGLEQCFVPGEVIVFSWIEWLRTFLEELEAREGERDDDESDDEQDTEDDEELHALEGKRATSDYFSVDEDGQSGGGPATLSSSLASLSLHPSSTDTNSPRVPRPNGIPIFSIQSGQPIVDRKSVFVAHLAPITQPTQVPWMILQLKQENKKVIKATHNIMAYRVENENGTISQGKDAKDCSVSSNDLLIWAGCSLSELVF